MRTETMFDTICAIDATLGSQILVCMIFLVCFGALIHFIMLVRYKLCTQELQLVITVYSELPDNIRHLVYERAEQLRKETVWNKIAAFFSDLPALSDSVVKDQVEPLRGALDLVRQLRVVRFRYDPSARKGSARRIGLIAQDLRAVVPEAVTTDNNGHLQVEYSCMIALLLEAVVELDQKMSQAPNTEITSPRKEQ